MLDRYSRAELRDIWSDEGRYRRWLDVELAVCDVLAERGQIPAEAAATIRSRARVDARREATVRYAAAWAAQQEQAARQRAVDDARQAADAVLELVKAEIRPRADGARAAADASTAAAELETART